MSDPKDGMNWAPSAQKPEPVVNPGEFVFASAFFDHGHIYGQTNGLRDAGGVCKWAWDPDPARLKAFCEKYPGVQPARSYQEILDDPAVHLVNAAAIPCERAQIGLEAMAAGKDYFTDKSPFTTLDQLETVRDAVTGSGRKYFCDYSERLHTESGWYAGELAAQGAIGEVVQVIITAPHRLNKPQRPAWFFDKRQYGGIITDIGSHQFDQLLAYTGATDGVVNFARVDNIANPDTPGLEDFGEASVTLNNGGSGYVRLDWFTPDGLRAFGDGKTILLGTKGFIEVRKYVELCSDPFESQVVYLVDDQGEHRIPCTGKVGYPFYGRFILDCLQRTETAMTQAHCFKAAELSMLAQQAADRARAAVG